jgi:hypothetical protein
MMAKRLIVFKTESLSSPGWEDRSLSHTGALTSILAEHYDYSDKPLPQTGDRLRNFAQFKDNAGSQFPGASTHVRWGDWEVSHVEEYVPKIPHLQYDCLAVCYCRYSPIESEWKELPKIQVPKLQELK